MTAGGTDAESSANGLVANIDWGLPDESQVSLSKSFRAPSAQGRAVIAALQCSDSMRSQPGSRQSQNDAHRQSAAMFTSRSRHPRRGSACRTAFAQNPSSICRLAAVAFDETGAAVLEMQLDAATAGGPVGP